MNFKIIDPDGAESDWKPLYIKVRERETLAPIAIENNGLILYEGAQRCIGEKELQLADEDSDIAQFRVENNSLECNQSNFIRRP